MRRSLATLAVLSLLMLASAPALADDGPGSRTLLHRRGHGHSHARPGSVRTVRIAPRPHVHSHRTCRYVPGHHETRVRRVVHPGHWIERVLPERYAVRWDPCSRRYVRVLVRPRRVVREWVPERVERRRERVWVPGRWTCGGC